MTLEAATEKYMVDRIRLLGGIALKLVPRYCKGVPDRLVVLPGPRIVFVEVKRPKGGRLSAHQKWWRERLTGLGCEWVLVATREDVDNLMEHRQ